MAKLFFAGDIFVPENISSILSPSVRDFFRGFDIVSCNFEGVLDEAGTPLSSPAKIGPVLRQSESSVQTLKNDGFHLFCLANNHVWDYGREGLARTIAGIGKECAVGAGMSLGDAYAGKIYELDGLKIGILAFGEYGFGAYETPAQHGGYAWINHSAADEAVRNMRSRVDFLVVQAHAGVEGTAYPLPEWTERYRSLVRAGADAVIGHHPHRVQPVEEYEDGIICYSLGNFYFGHAAHRDRKARQSLGIALTVPGNGKPFGYEKVFFEQREGTVSRADDARIASEFEDLCRTFASPEYQSLLDREVIRLWETRYRKLYVLARPSFSAWQFFKNLVRRLLGKALVNRNILLFHNISIESHRWAAQRALKLLEHIS
jgi:hypothetical protein